jgi:hypothetical protein
MRFTWKMAVVFLVSLLWLSGLHAQEKAETFSPYVDDQGRISPPGQGFHDVFTHVPV